MSSPCYAQRTMGLVKRTHPMYFILNNFIHSGAGLIFAELVALLKGDAVFGAVPHSREANWLAQKGRLADWVESGVFRRALRILMDAYLRKTIFIPCLNGRNCCVRRIMRIKNRTGSCIGNRTAPFVVKTDGGEMEGEVIHEFSVLLAEN